MTRTGGAGYHCDLCDHVTANQRLMINHRWQAHQRRGDVKGLRMTATPRPKQVIKPPPLRTCTLPGVYIDSGVRAPIDEDLLRRRAYDTDLGFEFYVGETKKRTELRPDAR